MTRQKEAKRFLLKAELLILVPLRNTFFLAGEAYPRRLIFFNFLGESVNKDIWLDCFSLIFF